MRTIARVMVMVSLLAGCSKKDAPSSAAGGGGGATAKLDEHDEHALRDFTKSLEAIGADVDRTRNVTHLAMALAEAAGPSFSPFGDYANADPNQRTLILAKSTDFVCDAKAGAAAASAEGGNKWALLATSCGAAYYGLPAGQEAMMSPTWFIVQRAGKWLAAARAKAAGHKDVLDPLDAAMKGAHFPLPVPGIDGLPRGNDRAPVDASTYVMVSADQITAGATPSAILTADGTKLEDVPGGKFPGEAMELAALDGRLHEMDRALQAGGAADDLVPAKVKVEEPPPPPEEDKAADDSGGTGTKMALEEGKMGKRDSARAEGQYHMRKGIMEAQAGMFDLPPTAPLLIASAQLPASRLFAVVRALPTHGARLALTGGDQHAVRFGVTDESRARANLIANPPHVILAGDKSWLWFGDDGQDAYTAAPADLLAKLKDIRAGGRDIEAIYLSADAGATTQDVIDLLDGVAGLGVRIATVDPEGTKGPVRGELGVGGIGPDPNNHGVGTIGVGSSYGTLEHPQAIAQPVVKLGNASATGDLDKEIIRKYIRQSINKIEYCYEKELVANPNLGEGTMTVKFVIGADGKVVTAAASGLGNAIVETCVAGVVKGISFPKPQGGGVVNVTYPFTFRNSGT